LSGLFYFKAEPSLLEFGLENKKEDMRSMSGF
jgi:hypothetical protein